MTELASTSTIELSGDQGVLVATGTDISAVRSALPSEPPLRVWRHEPQPADGAPPGEWRTPPVQLAANRLTGTAQAFLEMLVAGTSSPCDAPTARTAVAMVLAGYASSREGREMPVERLHSGQVTENDGMILQRQTRRRFLGTGPPSPSRQPALPLVAAPAVWLQRAALRPPDPVGQPPTPARRLPQR